jgi:hypothetical protein
MFYMYSKSADRSKFAAWLSMFGTVAIGLLGIGNCAISVGDEPIDFNRDIRPILAENCFYCHGQDAGKRQADLRLDDSEHARQAGVFVPGKASESELIARVHSTDPDVQMPPPKSNRKISAEQLKLLERWIDQGAKYSSHWAYIAPVRPAPPAVKRPEWVRTPIDRFVLAKLEAAELAPSPEADKATLIKRLHVDLVGLPPTIEQVDAFVADTDPLAYEKLVERLLNSEHYGERMALSWLDAARYADSNGFQQDGDTWQWIWRDWVVKALNENMPFDQFTIWQLAGDLLPDATNEQKIASGFNRNHLLNGEGGAIPEEQRFNGLFDRIDTTATTWLGLTMACAQCHDHKYDPITQVDYYSLMDAFNRVPETGTPQFMSKRIRVGAPVLELPTKENKQKFEEYDAKLASLDKQVSTIVDSAYEGWRLGLAADGESSDAKDLTESIVIGLKKPEAERTDEDKKKLDQVLRKHFEDKVRKSINDKFPVIAEANAVRKEYNEYRGDRLPRVMIMSDEKPRESFVLSRGEYLKPTDKVSFNTPAFLPALAGDAPRNRLGLAQWLMSPEHPLTARVQINRMWQGLFGLGIVKTTEDFGVQGEYPIHLELLDWLAVEFRESGWDMKGIQRIILNSATYRQSSRLSPTIKTRDIENRLFARGSRFRMPSMILRDWSLCAAQLLDRRLAGAPVYPYQPDAIWESLAITKERDFTYPDSSGADLYRRSLYTFWRRTVGPANMFDASNRQTCRVRPSFTSTPLHALTTLNDPTWIEAARVLAEHAMHHSKDSTAQLTFAFRQVLVRSPTEKDLALLRSAVKKQLGFYSQDPPAAQAFLEAGKSPRDQTLDVANHAALSAVCLTIMNLDEAITRE